jgi:hypothetical protein
LTPRSATNSRAIKKVKWLALFISAGFIGYTYKNTPGLANVTNHVPAPSYAKLVLHWIRQAGNPVPCVAGRIKSPVKKPKTPEIN